MTQALTETELQDVVISTLMTDSWRSEDDIARAVQHFELLYRGAHESGVEFEAIEKPREMFRDMLHALRIETARLDIDTETGDALFVPLSGASVNLSRTRMRRAPRLV
jgi:hypothetical protein